MSTINHQVANGSISKSYKFSKASSTASTKPSSKSSSSSSFESTPALLKPLLSFVIFLTLNAAKRPIHTIVSIAVLATTAHLSILNLSVPNYIDSLSASYYHEGGDSWSNNSAEWIQVSDPETSYPSAVHFAGAKLVFAGYPNSQLPEIPFGIDTENQYEKNLLIPYEKLNEWIESVSEITVKSLTADGKESEEVWRLRKSFSWIVWAKWNFSRLLDLIHDAETFDLIVILIGYLAMHYTFISLYLSMKRLGSKFWLATSVLLSSTFAFLLAYVTSFYLGVAVPIVTLSEGLPFLVATIGFGDKIRLTKGTLRALQSKSPGTSIENVVSEVICQQGVTMLRNYAVECLALFGGAMFGVNGLWQFCFLGAITLIYDYFITATFYSAILSIKVEIGKIKQKEILRQALEEDGISSSVAESVATDSSEKTAMSKKTNFSITIFKVLMVSAFLMLNLVQLASPVPIFQSFKFFNSSASAATTSGSLSENLIRLVPHSEQGAVVTILPAFIFEHASLSDRFDSVFHRFMRRWTETIGDPFISKFVVIGLVISIGLNAYLFNAARDPVVVKVVEKIIEVEKKVPVYVSNSETPFSESGDSSENNSDTEGLELRIGSSYTRKTTEYTNESESGESNPEAKSLRSVDESLVFMKAGKTKLLNNEEIVNLSLAGKLPLYALEKHLEDTTRAVAVRRAVVSRLSNTKKLEGSKLPFLHYDYDRVLGACCENVIGYVPLPIGVAGPLIIDGKEYFIPMATTEGCLVASTMRGCKAMNASGGVTTVLTHDGMTRGPCVQFPNLARAGEAKLWLDSEEGQRTIKKAFNSTSRFARLQHIKTAMAGTLLFIRFCTTTGDAMGMNMISKGVEHSLKFMAEECGFEDMQEISVSGNYCADKKPAAINWIEGRGKSVVAEAIVTKDVVERVLKSDVDALVELNISKNLVGSAMAGSIGGNNAQAANLVAAIFLATGQDPAQVMESANCITLMKNVNGNLHISVSMPSIEVGTIGGGTILEPQGAMLDLLGVRGPHPTNPGDNARQLAKIVAGGVMAAELSLCSALAAGHLVQSHMALNRSKAPTPNPGASSANIQRLTEGSKICIKS